MIRDLFRKENTEKKELKAERRQYEHDKNMGILQHALSDDQQHFSERDNRSDLLKWQQDLTDELETLKRRLKGEVFNGKEWVKKKITILEGNQYVKIDMPPLTNDLFVEYIEMQVEPFLSRNLFSSNFQEERILQMLQSTMNDIVDAMSDGWDIYGIDFANYDLVIRLIKNTIIPGPFRALNNGQRVHDRSISKRVDAYNFTGQEQENKSKWGVFGNA
jgi:hypothetical protein